MMPGAKQKISSVAEYEASVPEGAHSAWRCLRQAVLAAAPEAEEMISYQMPALKQVGMVVYFSATATHVALSFASPQIFEDMRRELSAFETGRSSIKFALDKPLPVALIKQIVRYRVDEEKQKTTKSTPTSKPAVAKANRGSLARGG
jgi:uncharacterized protein YdhG (YjbR/CyaY superfamily)